MVEIINRKYLRNLCKEKGWDFDKLIQNKQFMKGYNKIQRDIMKKVDAVLKNIMTNHEKNQ